MDANLVVHYASIDEGIQTQSSGPDHRTRAALKLPNTDVRPVPYHTVPCTPAPALLRCRSSCPGAHAAQHGCQHETIAPLSKTSPIIVLCEMWFASQHLGDCWVPNTPRIQSLINRL